MAYKLSVWSPVAHWPASMRIAHFGHAEWQVIYRVCESRDTSTCRFRLRWYLGVKKGLLRLKFWNRKENSFVLNVQTRCFAAFGTGCVGVLSCTLHQATCVVSPSCHLSSSCGCVPLNKKNRLQIHTYCHEDRFLHPLTRADTPSSPSWGGGGCLKHCNSSTRHNTHQKPPNTPMVHVDLNQQFAGFFCWGGQFQRCREKGGFPCEPCWNHKLLTSCASEVLHKHPEFATESWYNARHRIFSMQGTESSAVLLHSRDWLLQKRERVNFAAFFFRQN